MIKKLVSKLLAVVLIFSLIGVNSTTNIKASPWWLDDYYNDNGIAFDIVDGVAQIRGYTGTDTEVTIPNQVMVNESIYDVKILNFINEFAPNTKLKVLNIPGTIAYNYSTFSDKTLEEITIYNATDTFYSLNGVLINKWGLSVYPKGKKMPYTVFRIIYKHNIWALYISRYILTHLFSMNTCVTSMTFTPTSPQTST